MALQIVAGKPGSGKSYHTVTMLLQYLEDWALYERKEGKPFDRVLYTNLPLQNYPINDYLSAKVGDEVDVSHYIKPIDEDVRKGFIKQLGRFPLATLDNNAFIVIDEVQKMFGAEMDTDKKHKQFDIEFRNYISQHRHYGHDLIFITQHTDNISKAILAMAEKLYQVENAKHHGLPFPFNIPFADLDVVKEAFGFKQQFYRVSVGKYVGRRVRFDGETTSHLMTPEIFACYQSHTLSDVTSDRPSLNLTRLGAIAWLLKKHGWHLGAKGVIAVLSVIAGFNVLTKMPGIFSSAVSNSFAKSQAVTTSPLSDTQVNVTTPQMSSPLMSGNPIYNNGLPSVPSVHVHGPDCNHDVPLIPLSCAHDGCSHDHATPSKPRKDERITAVFAAGVITDQGRRRIGQTLMIDGVEETLEATTVRNGVVLFKSGKTVTVPQ